MFDRMSIRKWLAIGWVGTFMVYWMAMHFILLPDKNIIQELDGLEQSVVEENWPKASRHLENLDRIWGQAKLSVQVNNGSEEVTDFEHAFGQLQVLVNNKEDDALQYIGGLKNMARDLTRAFPGP